MCGIIGVMARDNVAQTLVDALKRLEYRGYDSAGIATLDNGVLKRLRSQGKIVNLEKCLQDDFISGHMGIGHTRWATHGKPTTNNAHPHMTEEVAVVHNGIIENYQTLRDELLEHGAVFESETDTEIVVHLFEREIKQGVTPLEATRRILPRLKGAFALVILFRGDDNLMIGARRGSPLVVGYGEDDNMFLGSDAYSLSPLTKRLCYLEDGDFAAVTRSGVEIYHQNADSFTKVERAIVLSNSSGALVGKGNYRHFMLKEIFEQPVVLGDTLATFVDMTTGKLIDFDFSIDVSKITRITMSACGTAFYACMVAKYWIERFAKIPVEVDIASELRYRDVPFAENGLSIFVSQSGETMDTLEAFRYCKSHGQKTLSIVNVPESTLARESDVFVPIQAGPEIGVASTKALTTQLASLACLSLMLAKQKGTLSEEDEITYVKDLMSLPRVFSEGLEKREEIEKMSTWVSEARDVLYIGRGLLYPIALEGALKLKEISYIHAEGYAAGELKHGPIALVEDNLPVVCLMPPGEMFEKTFSNAKEIMARGGRVIFVISDQDHIRMDDGVAGIIHMPYVAGWLTPILYTLPMQLLSYYVAVHKGADVDQPRNLAKSVTVE